MKLTIITVNFNNPEGLERTIQSVASQTVPPFEYIIVDGASTKGDVDIIRKYRNYITKWVSEKDTGIYNAMNKGVNMATGDYCLFLNSGDTLYDSNVCKIILSLQADVDFIEGRVYTQGHFSIPNKKYTLATFLWERNPYHQASLISRKMLLKSPYDESYRIAGDLAFNVLNLILNECTFLSIDLVISNYEGGGVSQTVNHDEEIRRCFSIIPSRIIQDYEQYKWINYFPTRNVIPILHRLTRSVTFYKIKILIVRLLGINNPERDNEQLELRKNKKI